MARILAGEIRKPRSISRRTLQVVAVLDREIVEALNALAPYKLDGGWFHVPPSLSEDWREKFALLSSVSISNEVGPRSLRSNETGYATVTMGEKAIVLSPRPTNLNLSRFIDGANLTPIGLALFSVLPFAGSPDIHKVAYGFKELDHIGKVEIGDLLKPEKGLRVNNMKELDS